MEATLAAPGPLDVSRTLARFRLWGEDPASLLADGVFRRALWVDGCCHGYELRWAGGPDDARLTVRVPGARSRRGGGGSPPPPGPGGLPPGPGGGSRSSGPWSRGSTASGPRSCRG